MTPNRFQRLSLLQVRRLLSHWRKEKKMIVDRVDSSRRHLRRTHKIVLQSTAWLIIGHVLTYAPVMILKIWPEWSKAKVDKFWSPWFKLEMERYWYFKNATDLFLFVVVFYVAAKIANKFSTSLFLASIIFLGYHVIDFFMFWWDFNGGFYIYIDLLWTALLLIKTSLFPFKEERLAKIRAIF